MTTLLLEAVPADLAPPAQLLDQLKLAVALVVAVAKDANPCR